LPPAAGLYQALAAAQAAIGRLGKSKQGARSKYAPLDVVIDAIRPAMLAQGLVVMQPTRIEGDTLIVDTTIVHAPTGESVSCTYPAGPITQPHQQLGSGVTYARRYSLMALLGVAPEDEDDDGERAGPAGRTLTPRQERGPARDLPDATAPYRAQIADMPSRGALLRWAEDFKNQSAGLSTAQIAAIRGAVKARLSEFAADRADDVFPGDLP
jgi:hypothetical protein